MKILNSATYFVCQIKSLILLENMLFALYLITQSIITLNAEVSNMNDK